MKVKDKINSIYKGYKNLIFTDEELEPLYSARHETCKSCEHNKLGICDLCGCVCKAKSHSPDEDCPDNKWLPMIRIDENNEIFIYRNELPENLKKNFNEEKIPYLKWKEKLQNE